MSNDFFNKTGSPSTKSPGASAAIRAEFAAIEAAFNKFPLLSSNAGKSLIVNAGGNGIDVQNNVVAEKDTSGGYVGLTLFKINFKNSVNTFTSYFTNSNTASRTYTFPNKDGTVAMTSDIPITGGKDESDGLAGLTLFKINFKNVAGSIISYFTNSNTAARTYTFPDKSGTVAMTSDIPASSTGLSSSPTTGIGYATGAGGFVTQTGNKYTSVTINKVCGLITTHSATMAAAEEASFIVYNSTIHSIYDMVFAQINMSGAQDYRLWVTRVGSSGYFEIYIKNISGGSLAAALPISFAVIRTVTS